MFDTAAEALAAWDNDDLIWTVEMGGMGPGYEQAIQVAMFEIIRDLLELPPDKDRAESDPAYWEEFRDNMDDRLFGRVKGTDERAVTVCGKLGLSGAQVGAARSLAYRMWRDGHKVAVESFDQDRRIMVKSKFPSL